MNPVSNNQKARFIGILEQHIKQLGVMIQLIESDFDYEKCVEQTKEIVASLKEKVEKSHDEF